ncbi:hypothetical protein XENOCAPTIV_021289 [Xenoophorus captivus]|uniref:Uncharacterized protein n=1 Tax=Xenoophorus captivus TaxID=1517983 RepID=A0ABV0Q5P0_9TELE
MDVGCLKMTTQGYIMGSSNHLSHDTKLLLGLYTVLLEPLIIFYFDLLYHDVHTASPHHPQQHFIYWGSLTVPRNHPLSGPEMVLTHRHCSEEGPAETALPAATQEVQPSTGAAGYLLYYRYSACSVFVHHFVVWLIPKIGQVQTTMNNQVCREDHQN